MSYTRNSDIENKSINIQQVMSATKINQSLNPVSKETNNDSIFLKSIEAILQQEEKIQSGDRLSRIAFIISKLNPQRLAENLFNLFSSIVGSSDNLEIINPKIDLLCQVFEKTKIGLTNLIKYEDPKTRNTVFHIAAIINHKSLINICLKNQGNPFLKNVDNETPFYFIANHYIKDPQSNQAILDKIIAHNHYGIEAIVDALQKAIDVNVILIDSKLKVKNKPLFNFLYEILYKIPQVLKEWEIQIKFNGIPRTIQEAATRTVSFAWALKFIQRRCIERTDDQFIQRLYSIGYKEYNDILFIFEQHKQDPAFKNDLRRRALDLSWLLDNYHKPSALEIANQGEFYSIAVWLMEYFRTKTTNSIYLEIYKEGEKVYENLHKIFLVIAYSQVEANKSTRQILKDQAATVLTLLWKLITTPDDANIIDDFQNEVDALNKNQTLLNLPSSSPISYQIHLKPILASLSEIAKLAQALKQSDLSNNIQSVPALANSIKDQKNNPSLESEVLSFQLDQELKQSNLSNTIQTVPTLNNSIKDEQNNPSLESEVLSFQQAIKNGDLDKVKLILRENEKLVNAVDCDGLGCLHYAVLSKSKNQINIIKQLIKKSSPIDIQGNYSAYEEVTPLWIATRMNKTEIIQVLLNANADVNLADAKEGYTPLINIIRKTPPQLSPTNSPEGLEIQKEIVVQMLNKIANVNQATTDGITVLHWATIIGDTAITQQLIEKHNAKIDAEATLSSIEFGKLSHVKPLFFAIKNTQQMVYLLDKYAEQKIEPIAARREDNTPLTLPEMAIELCYSEALNEIILRKEFSKDLDILVGRFLEKETNFLLVQQQEIATILIKYLLKRIEEKDYNQENITNLILNISKFLTKNISLKAIELLKGSIDKLSQLRDTSNNSILDIVIRDENNFNTAEKFIDLLKESNPIFSKFYAEGINAYKEAWSLKIRLTKDSQLKDIHDLNKSIFALNRVLLNPKDVSAIAELKRVAYQIAPGKPSFWKKFIGALLIVAGIALCIVAGAFTLGISVMAQASMIGLLGCGIFANGLQQKSLSKKLTQIADLATKENASIK